MTPEQFIYWLSGYLTNDPGFIKIEYIKDAIKQVKFNSGQQIFFYETLEESE